MKHTEAQCEWCEKPAHVMLTARLGEYVRYACGSEHRRKIERQAQLDGIDWKDYTLGISTGTFHQTKE